MANSFIYTLKASITGPFKLNVPDSKFQKETTFDSDFTLAQCQPYWHGLAEKVWQSLEKKQLNARGVNIKLKLKNFQTLQHSKSFKTQFILNKT